MAMSSLQSVCPLMSHQRAFHLSPQFSPIRAITVRTKHAHTKATMLQNENTTLPLPLSVFFFNPPFPLNFSPFPLTDTFRPSHVLCWHTDNSSLILPHTDCTVSLNMTLKLRSGAKISLVKICHPFHEHGSCIEDVINRAPACFTFSSFLLES